MYVSGSKYLEDPRGRGAVEPWKRKKLPGGSGSRLNKGILANTRIVCACTLATPCSYRDGQHGDVKGD